MLITDCKFLENELLDVARLFKSRPNCVRHSFTHENGVFKNDFEIDGERYAFENTANAPSELLFKRLERRFAKLALYKILKKNTASIPLGGL